jgi:hypothetical protein
MTYDPPVPWSPSGENEQPSTLPEDSRGQAINPQRRELKAAIEAFVRSMGGSRLKRSFAGCDRRGLKAVGFARISQSTL